MFIQLAQNFILHREREVYFSLVIVLVLVLFSASSSTSGSFIIYIALFALASTFVLVALQAEKTVNASHQSQADKVESSAVFPASITALGIAILTTTSALYMAIPQLPACYIGSSFGVIDYYYRDRGWEQQAEQSPEGETADTSTSQSPGGDRFFPEAPGPAPGDGTDAGDRPDQAS